MEFTWYWALALLLVLALVGLPAIVAVVASALALALFSGMPLEAVIRQGTASAENVFTYSMMAVFLVMLLGAALQSLGTVQTFPERWSRDGADPDRNAWSAGGALGLPLPLAATLIVAALIVEQNIGTASLAALPPAVVLCAAYLGVFLSIRFFGGDDMPRVAAGVVIARILVPLVGILVYIAPLVMGLVTPLEAIALLVFALALPMLLHAGLSEGGWGRLGRGLVAGAMGAANVALLVLAYSMLSFGLAKGGMGATMQELVAQLPANAPLISAILVGAMLVTGVILGPLAAMMIVALVGMPGAVAAGYDAGHIVVVLFLAAEAVRVGPMLWRGGFLKSRQVREDGNVTVERGTWPYYPAAILVALIFGALPPIRLF